MSLQGSTSRRAVTFLAGCLLGVLSLGLPSEVAARRHAPVEDNTVAVSHVVGLSSLPVEANDVHRRILMGGPFRYEKDGSVFGNRERQLPRQPRGFYREYTVPTPGERDRGARRIVCGGKTLREPETCYYSPDHYNSFWPIDPRR